MTAFLASLVEDLERNAVTIADSLPELPGEQAMYLEGYVDALNVVRRLLLAELLHGSASAVPGEGRIPAEVGQ